MLSIAEQIFYASKTTLYSQTEKLKRELFKREKNPKIDVNAAALKAFNFTIFFDDYIFFLYSKSFDIVLYENIFCTVLLTLHFSRYVYGAVANYRVVYKEIAASNLILSISFS